MGRVRKRTFVVAMLGWNMHPTVMHVMTAYERREALSDDDLVRLQAALADEVERYRVAIQGYSPDKMREHGVPFLAKLEERVAEVNRILTSRGAGQT